MSTTKSGEDAFTFLPQGCIIQEFRIGGDNIVLGFPSEKAYADPKVSNAYFGETIGRVANRISGAKINSLNNKSYDLAANNGPNTLHGGVQGWGKRTFEGPKPVNRNGKEAVFFKYLSPDGDEGFPGTVECRVWFSAGKTEDEGVQKTALEIEYEVELVGDEVEETVVAVTNHSYFNISDGPTIEGTTAKLHTNLHQEVDDDAIPTGNIIPYPGIQAGEAFVLGPTEPDIDHCFIMNPDPASVALDTRPMHPRKLCEFYHPNTRIHFEVISTEPAFQFYTGKFINTPEYEGEAAKGPRAGFCVEPSRYVNAANEEKYRGMVVLKKGQIWGSKIIYRGWKD